jgi:Alkylmercury lyase
VTLDPAARDAAADRDAAASDCEAQAIYAMCALDALGIPLLLRRDARIASQDALTGETIHVQVQVTDAAALTEAMGWEAEWSPASTVIYARAPEHEHEQECNVDAASACCPVINFFTTEAHARAWAEAHPVAGGVLLTQVDAIMYAMRMHGV